MKQLFANNAKTSLAADITASSTTLTVVDGSLFPTPGAFEYFLVTLELSGTIEIVMITGRTGNTLTVGGLGRGLEGTTAFSFTAGARLEVRITRDSLDRKSTQLYPITSLDNLVSPKNSYSSGYVASTFDPAGNPAITFAKDLNTWRFLNYTTIRTQTVTAATTTSATSTSLVLANMASGKYVVQFLTGTYAGYVRAITTNGSNAINWTTPLPGVPSVGDTFEILEANISLLQDAILAVALPVADNTGTANALTATYSPAIPYLSDNEVLGVVLPTYNTSTSVTFSPNGLTAKSVLSGDGSPLQFAQLSGTILLRYDQGSDAWFLISGGSGYGPAMSFFIGNF